MTKKKPATGDPSRLRKQAEKKAAATGMFADKESGMSGQMRQTLHELRVHQIELEMQNDELRRTQVELEASRARYFDLYDLAPVGYCTISEKNLLQDANLTIADMLGRIRSALIRQPFSRFILPEDQDTFYLLRKKSFQNSVSHDCELRLLKKDNAPFWVHLVISAYVSTDDEPGFRLVISDINERRQLEDARAFLLRSGYPGSNEDFFTSLAHYLAKNLQMDYVCIDRLSGDRLSAHTVAIYNNDHFDDNASYTLKDTPCGDTVGKDICCFPADVCRLFPDDTVLQALRAESFVGTTLWSFDGKPIGLISMVGRRPLADTSLAESMLKIVAIRAAGELERKEHENKLIRLNTHLEHQRIKLQAIIENVLEGIILCGLDGRLEKWNPAACVMHGFTHEEECVPDLSGFAGMFESRDSRGKILAPEELPIARVIRGERLSGVEVHIRRINQDQDWTRILSYHGHIVRDADGGTLLVVVMIRDITRFKDAEARINDIALFPEQNPSPVLRIDCNGLLLYGNPSSMKFRKQWGFASGSRVPREWNTLAQRSVADGRSKSREAAVGSRIFEFIFVPLKLLKYVNVYAFDITDRKRAETSLKKNRDGLEIQIRKRTATLRKTMETLTVERQRFNDVLNILPVYVVLIAPEFKVRFANRFFRERFGIVEDVHALEQHFNREIPYGSVKRVGPDKTLLPRGEEWAGPDNRHYEIHAFPFSDSDGTSLFMEMGIDITDRKRAEAALVEANEMKLLGQLALGVAHEVRNPLNGILAIMGALARELSDDFQTYMDHMQDQVNRLSVLMNDLLTLGRPLQAGKFYVIPLVELVEKVLSSWQPTRDTGKSPVRLVTPGNPEHYLIKGNDTAIIQMIVNLLDNADNNSPPETEIKCTIYCRTEGKVTLSVKDEGSGIPAEILPKIFDPFFTTRRGGTGLGLSIVRRIVEDHRGTISACNNNDEPGTTFEVEFPRCIR